MRVELQKTEADVVKKDQGWLKVVISAVPKKNQDRLKVVAKKKYGIEISRKVVARVNVQKSGKGSHRGLSPQDFYVKNRIAPAPTHSAINDFAKAETGYMTKRGLTARNMKISLSSLNGDQKLDVTSANLLNSATATDSQSENQVAGVRNAQFGFNQGVKIQNATDAFLEKLFSYLSVIRTTAVPKPSESAFCASYGASTFSKLATANEQTLTEDMVMTAYRALIVDQNHIGPKSKNAKLAIESGFAALIEYKKFSHSLRPKSSKSKPKGKMSQEDAKQIEEKKKQFLKERLDFVLDEQFSSRLIQTGGYEGLLIRYGIHGRTSKLVKYALEILVRAFVSEIVSKAYQYCLDHGKKSISEKSIELVLNSCGFQCLE